jgi:membrane-associated phospholipid phosphatase
MAVGLFLSPDVIQVPDAGLDPTNIRFGMDRDIIGNRSTGAERASDWARNAALLMPWAMAALTGPEGDRVHAMGTRTLLYAETFSISLGLTLITKKVVSRPRPFAYLPSVDRPDDGQYDPSRERTFLSMPSGHASAAWTATGLSMTEHLLYRPEATWVERAAVGVIGGALGASTAALRVRGGQHFPTDVIVGSALGLASGVTLPLLHRGSLPLPSTEAWLQMSGGMVVGTVLGVLLSGSF